MIDGAIHYHSVSEISIDFKIEYQCIDLASYNSSSVFLFLREFFFYEIKKIPFFGVFVYRIHTYYKRIDMRLHNSNQHA